MILFLKEINQCVLWLLASVDLSSRSATNSQGVEKRSLFMQENGPFVWGDVDVVGICESLARSISIVSHGLLVSMMILANTKGDWDRL